MRRPQLALLLAAGVIAGVSGPASALHGLSGKDFVPYTPEEHVYFHCEGATKIQNVELDGAIPWSTVSPSQSIQAGGGCASVDNGIFGNNQTSYQDSHFEGSYGGNIDAITVDAYYGPIGVYVDAVPDDFSLNVRLAIDGVPILGVNGRDVTVHTVPGGNFEHVRFTITGINLMNEANDTMHDVLLTLSGGTEVADAVLWPVRDTQTLWLYDATDLASGLVFNPTTVENDSIAR
ncbi:MAG: hypothetical protein ACRDH9_10030 [Actinomycetota bacterium]